MTGRERVLALLDGRPVDHLPLMPITMMFAADQIGAKYGTYALDHRVMVEAQIRTAEKFAFDHVSGITETREAPDCGAAVRYFEDQPYAMDEQNARLASKADLTELKMPNPANAIHMQDRLRGLALLKDRVGREKLVEGWVEGACGASADLRGINTLMLDFYDDPAFVWDLFEFVVELGIRFGRAQVKAGAELIGVGDPAASLVGPAIYREFVWPYEKKLVDGLHAAGARVRLHICGSTRRILEDIGRLGCDIVDIDSAVPLSLAREKMGLGQVLLGNLDPVRDLWSGSPESITTALSDCHRQAGPRYIVAAGCEVPRDTPPENIKALASYASSHQPEQ
jgi:MtaA/CmuA family methyltransferase